MAYLTWETRGFSGKIFYYSKRETLAEFKKEG